MQRILAADIGGTNCRFAGFTLDKGNLSLHRMVWIRSAGLLDTDMVLVALERELETPLRTADMLVLGLAGSVSDGLRGGLTNGALRVDLTGLEQRYGIPRALVINDFTAEAYGCLTEIGEQARCVVRPTEQAEVPPTASRGVLGAGTGLGTATLVHDGRGGWLPVAAEGGHASFPFVGDEENDFHKFSYLNDVKRELRQLSCWTTFTNEACHAVLREGLPDSPLYNGQIKSIGPRYCPSIETKIVTFADKPQHQLFLEPEGENTQEYYLNGFSSSLPLDIQIRALQTIPAFRDVQIYRPGYAIEYDFFDPTQLKHNLETKKIKLPESMRTSTVTAEKNSFWEETKPTSVY